MKHYSLLPSDWDYTKEQQIKEQIEKGYITPCEIQEVVDCCGSLYPYITSKSKAVAFAKDIKKRFPFVCFNLFEGSCFGELELVKSF